MVWAAVPNTLAPFVVAARRRSSTGSTDDGGAGIRLALARACPVIWSRNRARNAADDGAWIGLALARALLEILDREEAWGAKNGGAGAERNALALLRLLVEFRNGADDT